MQLVEQAKLLKQIIIPKIVHDDIKRKVNVNAIQKAQKHLGNLTGTTVSLCAPYGGASGEFGSKFEAWMRREFRERADFYMDAVYHVTITLEFKYALTGLPNKA
jgi:hypothetical protein